MLTRQDIADCRLVYDITHALEAYTIMSMPEDKAAAWLFAAIIRRRWFALLMLVLHRKVPVSSKTLETARLEAIKAERYDVALALPNGSQNQFLRAYLAGPQRQRLEAQTIELLAEVARVADAAQLRVVLERERQRVLGPDAPRVYFDDDDDDDEEKE